MKKFVLAALAALSLGMGIGTAYAHPTVYRNGVEIWGAPADIGGTTGG